MDIHPRCRRVDIFFHPFNKNGKNRIAPITCSMVIIKKDGSVNKFWRMKPSKLQRIAAMMTARAGAYFFIIESYAKVICWCKPLKRIIYACPPMAEKLDISIPKDWIAIPHIWFTGILKIKSGDVSWTSQSPFSISRSSWPPDHPAWPNKRRLHCPPFGISFHREFFYGWI